MPSKKLPQGWKNCPRFGDLVSNIFFPFKVPLDESYNSKLSPSSYFTPNMLINYARQNQIDIGLWIDLTNTDRFYSKELIESYEISYVKLKCKGYEECPGSETVHLFVEICSKFTMKNPDKKIAVHCTHGFNRTGFLIVAYLVEQENWSIEAAVETFARARPPGIYKQDYLDQLLKFYGEPDVYLQAPLIPIWKTKDSDLVIQNDESPSNENNCANNHLLEGIDEVILLSDQEQIQNLRRTCSEMCKFQFNGFPGCQPVSMTHKNIKFLQEEEYLVSWKADGTRYLLLIVNAQQMYFFDRDYQVYQIFNLTFLKRNMQEHLSNTLLDGEMVVDIVNEKRWPRFLIYDIIFCDGNDVSKLSFRERLNIIFKQIISPREIAKQKRQIDRNKEPIGVRIKDFCELKNTYKFFGPKFQKDLSHEIDGLIFQPVKLAYLPGRCNQVLKWKPPSHNSVDFLLRIVEETRPGRIERYLGQLFVGGKNDPFDYIQVTNELKKYNNKIIECRFNIRKNAWEFMRIRNDKSYPNGLNTANNVVYSIQHPITLEYLLDYIKNDGFK